MCHKVLENANKILLPLFFYGRIKGSYVLLEVTKHGGESAKIQVLATK